MLDPAVPDVVARRPSCSIELFSQDCLGCHVESNDFGEGLAFGVVIACCYNHTRHLLKGSIDAGSAIVKLLF